MTVDRIEDTSEETVEIKQGCMIIGTDTDGDIVVGKLKVTTILAITNNERRSCLLSRL